MSSDSYKQVTGLDGILYNLSRGWPVAGIFDMAVIAGLQTRYSGMTRTCSSGIRK